MDKRAGTEAGMSESELEIVGQSFQAAGRDLRSARALRYWAHAPNLVGFPTLGIPELISASRVGAAGQKFVWASERVSPECSSLIGSIGADLDRYKRLTYRGRALFYGGLALGALGGRIEARPVGLALGLPGLGASAWSVVDLVRAAGAVGEAGKGLKAASAAFHSPVQRQLVREAGEDLGRFGNRTRLGKPLSAAGGLTLAVGAVVALEWYVGWMSYGISGGEEPEEPWWPYAMLGGGVVWLAGHVLSEWMAPWSMGSAGAKLERAGELMLQRR